LTIVISHSPVQVGVGFTTIFNQFVVINGKAALRS
jgi:hypothetical protein